MDTLERLRRRLHNAQQLYDITKTMKSMAAASIHQFEEAAASIGSYHDTVERGLQVALATITPGQSPTLPKCSGAAGQRCGAIVLGSEMGLCGRFNASVIAHARNHLEPLSAGSPDNYRLTVGARLRDLTNPDDAIHSAALPMAANPEAITQTVQAILLQINRWRQLDENLTIYLYHNRAQPTDGYVSQTLQVWPVDLQRFKALRDRPWPGRCRPVSLLPPEQMLAQLLRHYLFATLFRACAESLASEHDSRLRAMQRAQRQLDERLTRITHKLHTAQQDAISAELLELTSGFEATGDTHATRDEKLTGLT